jgi:hypothetical protein
MGASLRVQAPALVQNRSFVFVANADGSEAKKVSPRADDRIWRRVFFC